MLWSRDSIDAIDTTVAAPEAAAEAAAEELPAEPASPPQPVVSSAASTPSS